MQAYEYKTTSLLNQLGAAKAKPTSTRNLAWLLQQLGKAIGAATGELAAVEIDKLLQSLSLTLQRENARAVLRRRPGAEAEVLLPHP